MTKRRRKRPPDQIVRKLHDADAMLNAGKQLADAEHDRSMLRELLEGIR